MKVGGGHGKGSSFERKIAKEIVKAFKGFGITQRDCWRSTLSGGHDRSAGDLEISQRFEKLFPCCLEMKHYRKIRYENFLLSKDSKEKKWLVQTVAGSKKRKGTTPVLVMRANHLPVYALVGPRSELHDNGPELWIGGELWKLLPWKKFLELAVRLAKELDWRSRGRSY